MRNACLATVPVEDSAWQGSVFSPKSHGELRFDRVNAPTSKELNALVATISECVARYLERRGRPAKVGGPEMSCSHHLTLALDDEEGNTMQQLLRPLDHVPDSHGSAGRAQSADSLRGPLQTIPAWEEEYGTEQLGRNTQYRDCVTPIRCGKLKKLSANANAASRWIERAGSEQA